MEQPITKLDYFAGQILNAMMVTSGSKNRSMTTALEN